MAIKIDTAPSATSPRHLATQLTNVTGNYSEASHTVAPARERSRLARRLSGAARDEQRASETVSGRLLLLGQGAACLYLVALLPRAKGNRAAGFRARPYGLTRQRLATDALRTMPSNRFPDPNTPGTIYLLHFSGKTSQGRQHYLGWSRNPDIRLRQHRAGAGAGETRKAVAEGLKLTQAQTWKGTPLLERRPKEWSRQGRKGGFRYVPASPLLGCGMTDLRSTQLSRGGATLLSSQTSDPQPAASDTTRAGQTKVDSKAKSQLAAGPNSTGPVGQPRPATTP